MGTADSSSQTGPDYWLFANLKELSLLAPHFLPVGWCVVTYSCAAEDGISLGFAHNLYHPQLKKFVCDRAIYISQLSYSVGSVRDLSQETLSSDRNDGFQITCEQYHVGGPSGRRERYESIVFIQYISELLRIIETLDQKSSTLLLVPEHNTSKAQDKCLPDDDIEAAKYSDVNNYRTFQKMFGNKTSSKGRTIQVSNKVDESIEQASEMQSVASNKSTVVHRCFGQPSEAPDANPGPRDDHLDSITISDSAGNILAHIQDPTLSLKDVVCVDGASMDKENDDNLKSEAEPLKSRRKETANDVESPFEKLNENGKDGGVVSSAKCAKWKTRKRKKTARKATKPAETSALNVIDHAISVELDFDTKTSTWKCDICQSSFAKSDELNSHLDSHSDLKHFRCEICGTRFTKKHNLTYHMKTVHEGRRKFKCDVCGKAFMKGHDLKRHSNTHDSIRSGLVCKYCNKVYYTQQNFDLHVAGHEGDDKGFRWCLICGLKLRYHQHKYHMKKHQGPANCYDCDRTYNNVEILRRHIKMNHGDVEEIKCPHCEETFKSKTEWRAHSRAIHEPGGAAIIQCKTCLRTFASLQQLKLHAAIHLNEDRPLSPPKARHSAAASRQLAEMVEAETSSVDVTSHLPPPLVKLPETFELSSLQIEGQTVILSKMSDNRVREESDGLSGVVNGNLSDVFFISHEADGAENPTSNADNTIWIEGVSAENLTFEMIS